MEDKITIGDKDLIAPADSADKDADTQAGAEGIEGLTEERGIVIDLDLDQIDQTASEGIEFKSGGEAKHPSDFGGSGEVRIDRHRESELIFHHKELIGVIGITDPGDGMSGAQFFSQHTAEEVKLITAGSGDKEVSVLDAGFFLDRVASAVAADTDSVIIFDGSTEGIRAAVDDDEVMPFSGEAFGERLTDLTVADDDDLQEITPFEGGVGGYRYLRTL